MQKEFYSVDQVAQLLQLHPKTIQRYIREGRLIAKKIGKSWRIDGHDLSQFTEGPSSGEEDPSSREEPIGLRKAQVSSVIDLPVSGQKAASRVMNNLTALANSKPTEYGHSEVRIMYIDMEHTVRISLWGSLEFMMVMMTAVQNLVEET